MRYNRVFLIQPFYKERHYHFAYLPVGLGYLAEYLKSNNIAYDFLDMNMDLGKKYSFRRLIKRIKDFGPDIIGVSMFTYRYKSTFEFINKLKNAVGNIDIVAGGPHVSTMDRKVLEDCPAINYGITLEGEDALVELCRGKELSGIKGLIYRDKENIVNNGPRGFITDVDKIPFPKYDKFYLKGYPPTMMILTSRGCPYDCIFCAAKTTIGKALRTRSSESVAEEISYWYKKGWHEFGIADDNFTFSKKRVLDICDRIESLGMKDLRLSCGNGVRADRIDRELLNRMKEVGFYQISMGVEAGNNKVLKNIKKGEAVEAIENAIKLSCEMGFEVRLFFLLGSPGETEPDIEDSMRLASKYPVATSRFYNIVPFPKTELYEWVKRNNFFLRDIEEYLNNASSWDKNDPIFDTPELPRSKRVILAEKTDRLRHRVEADYYLRLLGNNRLFFRFLAYVYTTHFVQDVLLRVKFIRKAVIFLKRALGIGH